VSNAIAVQVIEGSCYLVDNTSRHVLAYLKLLFFHVMKQISSSTILQHQVHIIRTFKYVQKMDDIGVLAQLEDFDFSLLELQFRYTHILFLYDFDSHLSLRLFMNSKLYLAKLAHSKVGKDLIIVLYRRLTDCLL
jgi:hypothetical protein